MKEMNPSAVFLCLFLSRQLPIKPTYLQQESDAINIKQNMTKSCNVFILQLNKETIQVLLFLTILLLMQSSGMGEYKGDFPPAAEAVYARSTQAGETTKRGRGVKTCTMTTLLSDYLNQSLL